MKYLLRINGAIADPYEPEVMDQMVEAGDAKHYRNYFFGGQWVEYYVLPHDDRA